jgi:biopolymer transport protein TolQ
MEIQLSIIQLILEASLIVKLVMLLLLVTSIASWVVIFEKQRSVKEATKEYEELEDLFWSGKELDEVGRILTKSFDTSRGPITVFLAGLKEFRRSQQRTSNLSLTSAELASRSMRIAQVREIDRLEKNLAFLATTGSTSPYVGLFGTVWGIMNSFLSLGSIQTATLALVAPGIAEALVATAMGLFAAIPAVIAFNRYSDQINRLEISLDTFIEEFSGILARQQDD